MSATLQLFAHFAMIRRSEAPPTAKRGLEKAHHSARLAILASREKDRKEKVGEKKVAEIVRAKL